MSKPKAYLEPMLRRVPDGLQLMVCAETDKLYWRSPYGLYLSETQADELPADKAYLASKEVWGLLARHSKVRIIPFSAINQITNPSER